MKIAIASEHAGYELKEKIKAHLIDKGYDTDDLGASSSEPIDYPFIAAGLAGKGALGQYDKGILLCGTGVGMTMAAGKVPGIRAALCTNAYMAKMTREHNDANVLCLGAWITGLGLSLEIVDTFLSREFTGGRHIPRVDKIRQLEEKYGSHLGK
jgi:ribose 5-phosphate isomerase B